MFDIHKITSHLKGFVETKIELLKLDAREKVSAFIAKAIIFSMMVLFIFLALLLALIGASIKINLLLESRYLGYLVTAGILFIIILCLGLFLDKKAVGENLKQKFNKEKERDENK